MVETTRAERRRTVSVIATPGAVAVRSANAALGDPLPHTGIVARFPTASYGRVRAAHPQAPELHDAAGEPRGCLPDPLPAKMMLRLSTKVEAQTATRFFATCPQLAVHASQDEGILGESSVTVSGTPEAISRALQAPFGVHATWGCEPELD